MHYFFYHSETLRPTSPTEQENNSPDPTSLMLHGENAFQVDSPVGHDSSLIYRDEFLQSTSPTRPNESPQSGSPMHHGEHPQSASPMHHDEHPQPASTTPNDSFPMRNRLKNELRLQCELLMQEDDLETIQHNLKVLRSCRFSGRNDFRVTDDSKKIKFTKQPDFEPKNRKLPSNPIHIHQCLFGSDRVADKSSLQISHSAINAYLELIATNFSQEKAKIVAETTLMGQKIFSNGFERQNKTDEVLALIPFHKNDEWCLQVSGTINDVFDKENLGYLQPWQSGYSMLLKCTQILTSQNTKHTDQLISRFRKFLSDILSNEDHLMDFCYKCFKFLHKKSFCLECPLTFCQTCINNNLCPRH